MPGDTSGRGPYGLNEVVPDLLDLQCDAMNNIDDAIEAIGDAYSNDGKITADEMPGILVKLHHAHAAAGDARNITELIDERKLDAAKAAVLRRRQSAAKRQRTASTGKG